MPLTITIIPSSAIDRAAIIHTLHTKQRTHFQNVGMYAVLLAIMAINTIDGIIQYQSPGYDVWLNIAICVILGLLVRDSLNQIQSLNTTINQVLRGMIQPAFHSLADDDLYCGPDSETEPSEVKP